MTNHLNAAFIDSIKPQITQYFITNLDHFTAFQVKAGSWDEYVIQQENIQPPVPEPVDTPVLKNDRKSKLKQLKEKRLQKRKAQRKERLRKRKGIQVNTSLFKETNGEFDYNKFNKNNVGELAVSGILRGCGDALKFAQKENIPYWYLDNGYLNKDYRVCFNNTVPDVIVPGEPRYNHKIKLENWRGGHGRDIIILPPSVYYREFFNLKSWLQQTVDSIAAVTNKPIIVRPKVLQHEKRPDWNRQLETAYCVVTWGSALALDALIKGVPVISLGNCPTKSCSFTIKDIDTDRVKQEPQRLQLINSLTWFNYDLNELPQAYSIIKSKLQHDFTPPELKLQNYGVEL